jgi:predicted metal-dependent phosphoesterase TrpH
MVIDMHIHTRFSPCSIIRVRQLFSIVKQKGLDGICITDHDTIASLPVIKNIPETSGICIFLGIEYTTRKGDFLVFGPVEYIPQGLSAEKLLAWVKKEGGVVIPAHPFRKSRPADYDILHSFEIIELLNGRNSPSENESCRKWFAKYGNGKMVTGGSDAHTLEEVGKMVTVFNKNIYSIEALINELKYGKYTPMQKYDRMNF